MKKIWIAGNISLCANYKAAVEKNIGEAYVSLSPPSLPYDGLILPGGGDIHPSLFHQEDRGSKNIDLSEDLSQLKALGMAVCEGRPVLGICKGMQIINVYFGGDIQQDLDTAPLHAYDSGDKMHPCFAASSFLSLLYGPEFVTNSAHHQGLGNPGLGIRIIQRSCDGVAEAIVHDRLPVIGVQWHPERMPGGLGDRLFCFFSLLCGLRP